MATFYTEEYFEQPIVDNYIDRAPDDKADDIFKRLSKRIEDETINNHSPEWTVRVVCFNCSYESIIRHKPIIQLTDLIRLYTKFVCKSCGFVNGNSSPDYKFYGLVEIINAHGSIVHVIDRGHSKTVYNNDSAVIDNNRDNAFISIWDDPPKKAKMNKTIARIIEDSDISDDDYRDDEDDFGR